MANSAAYANPTLAAIDPDEIPSQTREGKASRLVEEFLSSGMQAAEIQDGAPSASVALRKYVKDNGKPVRVIHRKDNGVDRTFLKYDESVLEGEDEGEE